MTTRNPTCTEPKPDGAPAEVCGGQIKPSYIEIQRNAFGEPTKSADAKVHPAECERCGKTYADVVSVAMTRADLDLIGQRMSESTRQGLQALASERAPGTYAIELTEYAARDLASKAANLGLVPVAAKVRQELDALATQRHPQ